VTDSMRRAMDETGRRRVKQLAYNQSHGITPRSVEKSVDEVLRSTSVADAIGTNAENDLQRLVRAADAGSAEELIARLESEMLDAARKLEFELAASLRDRIDDIRATLVTAGAPGSDLGSRGRRDRAAEPRRIKRRFGPDR
jgi:excinuclease ABC subunit B